MYSNHDNIRMRVELTGGWCDSVRDIHGRRDSHFPG